MKNKITSVLIILILLLTPVITFADYKFNSFLLTNVSKVLDTGLITSDATKDSNLIDDTLSISIFDADGNLVDRNIDPEGNIVDKFSDTQVNVSTSVSDKKTTDTTETKNVDDKIEVEETRTVITVTNDTKEEEVINTDNEIREDNNKLKEEYKNLLDNLKVFYEQSDDLEEFIKDEINKAIDNSITQIRSIENVPTFELQSAIESERKNLDSILEELIQKNDLTDAGRVTKLEVQIDQSISVIENTLEDVGGVNVDISTERQNIRKALTDYQVEVRELDRFIDTNNVKDVFVDSDRDGISDFDEVNIYGTDPRNSKTAGSDLTDSQKILRGIDPISGIEIDYQNVKEDVFADVIDIYKVDSVEVIQTSDKPILEFKGTAAPNSFVTLYIFSTPIVITVQANSNGEWEYQLDRELEDGTHEIYVTTVDNSGRIVAKSSPIGFAKTAEAAVLGVDLINLERGDLFSENYLLLIVLVIVASVVILTLMFLGHKKGQEALVQTEENINTN
jgi:hypothetical protein